MLFKGINNIFKWLINNLLLMAAEKGSLQAVRFFLYLGADIEARDSYDRTALHCAARHGYTEITQALLDAGADIKTKVNTGGAALHWAAYNGHTETIQPLIDAGADIEAKDNNGWTALHWAAYNGHTETMQALLSAGADKEAKANNDHNALHLAAYSGHTETVQALLDAGADKEAKDNDGWTALIIATRNDQTETVIALLDAGAEIEVKDRRGKTTLHWAAYKGDTAMVNALLASGADINATSDRDLTALRFANVNGHTKTVNALHDWSDQIEQVKNILKQGTHEECLSNNDEIKPEALFVVLSSVSLPTLLAQLRKEIDGLITLSYLNKAYKKYVGHNNPKRIEQAKRIVQLLIKQHIPHKLNNSTIESMTAYIMQAAHQGSCFDKTKETKAEQAREKEKAASEGAVEAAAIISPTAPNVPLELLFAMQDPAKSTRTVTTILGFL